MTNEFEQSLKEKYDLDFAYEMAQQAIDTQDYDQSLQISRKALAEAQQHNKFAWIRIFEKLIENILQSQEKSQVDGELNYNSVKNQTELNKRSPSSIQEDEKNKQIEQKSALLTSLQSSLKRSDYFLLPKEHSLSIYFHGIDGIACRVLNASPSKQILLLIPFRVSTSQEKIIVTENSINSSRSSASPISITPILKICDTILEGFLTSGGFCDSLSHLLQLDLHIQKTSSKKHLSLISGTTRYVIRVEPLFVLQNVPGFKEKSILFAYQRQNNLHVISMSQLERYLAFLEKKLFFIENFALSYREQFNSELLKNKRNQNIRKLSYPFITFGIVFGFILASGLYDFLKIFITLGYASIVVYIVGLIFLFLQYQKVNSKVTDQFITTHYQGSLSFDEADLTLIREELSIDEMVQFSYECFGKNPTYKILEKIEKEQIEKLSIPKKPSKEILQVFETSALSSIKSTKNESQKLQQKDHTLIQKYSTFLDD